MSAGMAEVIAAHQARYLWPGEGDEPMECECGHWRGDVVEVHAAHVAEELTKAGCGNVQEALLTAADEMEQERSTWCLDESGHHWIARTLNDLRRRAHANDPEGHALVQAIHDRKAEG